MFSAITVYSASPDYEGHYGTFRTEADAVNAIDTYGWNGNGWARLVRPATWQEVAAVRLNIGEWVRPVWTREDFWQERSIEMHQHFAHISLDDPTMIAFTPDAAKGEAGRQTRMKPGRYLNRFFPELGAKRIAFMAEWWVSGQRPAVALEGAMALATTGDEIVSVYEADVDSCMQGEDCVRVYAAGDLAVAYWTDGEGEVTARALCWPEKGVYGRVYPSPDDENEGDERAFGTALLQAMEAKGWTSARLRGQGFNGARLLKVCADDGGYVMPYLDHGYGVNDNGCEWEMNTNYEHSCDSTGGTIDASPAYDWTCDHCDEGQFDDSCSTEVVTYFRDGHPCGEQYWCQHCVTHDAFICEGLDMVISYSRASVEVDGQTYAEAHALKLEEDGVLFRDADGGFTHDEPEADDVTAEQACWALGVALTVILTHLDTVHGAIQEAA
jgi:hypothetical protein